MKPCRVRKYGSSKNPASEHVCAVRSHPSLQPRDRGPIAKQGPEGQSTSHSRQGARDQSVRDAETRNSGHVRRCEIEGHRVGEGVEERQGGAVGRGGGDVTEAHDEKGECNRGYEYTSSAGKI